MQLQKIKRIRTSLIREPSVLEDIQIPEYLKYVEGELFVLGDKRSNGERDIILGTNSRMKLLAECSCGNYTVYTVSCKTKLYTLNILLDEQKVERSLLRIFLWTPIIYTACKSNIHLNLQRIFCDFEKTIVLAAKQFIPDSNYKGCYFHFGQILWRRVEKLGLTTKVGNSEELNFYSLVMCLYTSNICGSTWVRIWVH